MPYIDHIGTSAFKTNSTKLRLLGQSCPICLSCPLNPTYLSLRLSLQNKKKSNFRTNENGLCPACRQSYPEDPVNFQPLSSAEVHKIKTEKKQKVLQQKNKIIEDRKHLSEYRVLQKNLVYAVGISQRMANPELLKKFVFDFLNF